MHPDAFHEYRTAAMLKLKSAVVEGDNREGRRARIIRGINSLSTKQKIERAVNLLLRIEKARVMLVYRFRRILNPPMLQLSYQRVYSAY